MDPARHMDTGDAALIRIVDAALAEAARRSGPWLVCRPGCTQCCMGPFPITQLDARRLRRGMRELAAADPARATVVRERARQYIARIAPDFPGDPSTGVLEEGETAEERFTALADEEPCPALDPATGLCDIYAARPMTCRTFGPPVRCGEEALGVCELCYRDATPEQIAGCEVHVDPGGLEEGLLDEWEKAAAVRGRTIVAFPLAG